MLINTKILELSKNRNICCNPAHTHTKFQSNIFIFGCVMVKKSDKGDEVTFLNAIFAFLIAVRKNKSFLESWEKKKMDKISMCLEDINVFENLTFFD